VRVKQLVKRAVIDALANQGYSLERMSELGRLADLHGSDKGTRMSAHRYTRVYDRLFHSLRSEHITFVEIGLMRRESRRASTGTDGTNPVPMNRAPSLEMWRNYFPNATIFGFDIDDFSSVKIDRCAILRGDMSCVDDLRRLTQAVGGPIDVLLEDGSHASHHQQIALGSLFPSIRSKGIYLIEDLHWQDERFEKAEAVKTKDILRRFQVEGVFVSQFLSQEQQAYIQDNLERVWLFDSLTSEVDDSTDALAVLIKK